MYYVDERGSKTLKSGDECRLKGFEEWLCNLHMSTNTVNVYVRAVRYMLEYMEDGEQEKRCLIDFQEHLAEKYKPGSVNLYLIACRKYHIYCGYEGRDLPKPLRVQTGQSVENILSLEEYERMLDYARKNNRWKDYLIMRTLACTGIRVSELSYVTVETLSVGKAQVYNKNKYREIYLPDKLIEDLRNYCRSNRLTKGPILLGSHGTGIDRRSVWEMLQKTAQRCGIEKSKAHPHSFRHLFARMFIGQYANLAELADILGHSSIETTRRYTMSSMEEKRKKIDKLPL